MDLGITGRNALVCASSKGLGRGCAEALAREGANVTILARTEAEVKRAAEEIGTMAGRQVRWVACDVTTPEGRAKALAACPEPDILINNAGGPPPGDFRDWDRAAWLRAIDANMLTPIEELGLSNGARSGLTGFVAGLARKVAQHGVTINNLLPGSFDTARLRSSVIAARAKAAGKSVDEMIASMQAAIPARRLGNPAEFGEVCAFICSVQAGYLVGQNILLDGGAYPGTF